MKHRVYIAGPYNPYGAGPHEAVQRAQRNVDTAIETANKVIKKGHFVFIPHLSHYVHTHYSCKEDYYDWWYDEDFTFLNHWATAILMLPKWKESRGARLELELAEKNGLKVFYNINEID
jgi:hypothetical protein